VPWTGRGVPGQSPVGSGKCDRVAPWSQPGKRGCRCRPVPTWGPRGGLGCRLRGCGAAPALTRWKGQSPIGLFRRGAPSAILAPAQGHARTNRSKGWRRGFRAVGRLEFERSPRDWARRSAGAWMPASRGVPGDRVEPGSGWPPRPPSSCLVTGKRWGTGTAGGTGTRRESGPRRAQDGAR
jgi:hypothetical protein